MHENIEGLQVTRKRIHGQGDAVVGPDVTSSVLMVCVDAIDQLYYVLLLRQ